MTNKVKDNEYGIRLIYVTILVLLIIILKFLPNFFSNYHFGSYYAVKRSFNNLRNAILFYYLDNNIFPDNIEELKNKKYLSTDDFQVHKKKIEVKYEKLVKGFRLECSLKDLGKTFLQKHDNSSNDLFLFIISKIRNRKDINVIFIDEKKSIISVSINISKDSFLRLKNDVSKIEKDIQNKFSKKYNIQIYKP